MLQNMLITALTPLSVKKEVNSWENRPFATVWPEKQKSKDITRSIKKKPKRVRTAFSTEQLRALEKTYSRFKYINSERRHELAKSLNIGEKCIKIWFQNRRMKEKRGSSESNSDTSSESLGNETPLNTATPPPEIVKFEQSQTEYTNQYYHCNGSEYSYQLPPHYNINGGYQDGYQIAPNVPTFYNDNNIYPTHYYPVDIRYQSNENNNSNIHYNYEMSQYWANHNPYYAPI